jgi:hypothetical protein
MTNPADLFFGESSPSAKFDAIGTTVGGPITHIGQARQQTDFRTGKPLTWDDGSPRMQLPVTVQTDLRDPSNPTDDGKRTFYIKGEMKKAVQAALAAAGAKMAEGGTLTISYVGDEPTKGFPKKLYSATYVAPTPGAGFFDQQPQQAAPQPVAQPVQQHAPQYTPEQYAAMQAAAQQQVQQPQATPPQASYAEYAAQMGFTPQPTNTPPF